MGSSHLFSMPIHQPMGGSHPSIPTSHTQMTSPDIQPHEEPVTPRARNDSASIELEDGKGGRMPPSTEGGMRNMQTSAPSDADGSELAAQQHPNPPLSNGDGLSPSDHDLPKEKKKSFFEVSQDDLGIVADKSSSGSAASKGDAKEAKTGESKDGQQNSGSLNWAALGAVGSLFKSKNTQDHLPDDTNKSITTVAATPLAPPPSVTQSTAGFSVLSSARPQASNSRSRYVNVNFVGDGETKPAPTTMTPPSMNGAIMDHSSTSSPPLPVDNNTSNVNNSNQNSMFMQNSQTSFN